MDSDSSSLGRGISCGEMDEPEHCHSIVLPKGIRDWGDRGILASLLGRGGLLYHCPCKKLVEDELDHLPLAEKEKRMSLHPPLLGRWISS